MDEKVGVLSDEGPLVAEEIVGERMIVRVVKVDGLAVRMNRVVKVDDHAVMINHVVKIESRVARGGDPAVKRDGHAVMINHAVKIESRVVKVENPAVKRGGHAVMINPVAKIKSHVARVGNPVVMINHVEKRIQVRVDRAARLVVKSLALLKRVADTA